MTETWVQMVTGRRVDLLNPRLAPSAIGDLAWSLARLPRFLGHVATRPYSVAQHCLLVAEIAAREGGERWRLPALLHDAHEALIGDIPTPVLEALGVGADLKLGGIKMELDRAICKAVAPDLDPGDLRRITVRFADRMAFLIEWRDLMYGEPPRNGSRQVDLSAYQPISILSETEARQAWLTTVQALAGKGVAT